MDFHRQPPARHSKPIIPAEPTVRRVKGSRNLSTTTSISEIVAFPAIMLEPLQNANLQSYMPSLTLESVQVHKTNSGIAHTERPPTRQTIEVLKAPSGPLGTRRPLKSHRTPFDATAGVSPSHLAELASPRAVVKVLPISESLAEKTGLVPEPHRVLQLRPPINFSAGAIEAGKQTLEVVFRPSPRRQAREPATDDTHRQSPASSTNLEKEEIVNRDAIQTITPFPSSLLALPNAWWELSMTPNLSLGGNIIPSSPTPPRSRRKAWKKSRFHFYRRRDSFKRKISQKLMYVRERLLKKAKPQQLLLDRNLVVEKRDILRTDKDALEREVRDLKERVNVLELAYDEAERDALREEKLNIETQEQLQVEHEKVLGLQQELESSRQGHLVSDAAFATGTRQIHSSMPRITTVSADLFMQNTRNPILHNGHEPLPAATSFSSRNHPSSFSKLQGQRYQTHSLALSELSGIEADPIHELPSTILESRKQPEISPVDDVLIHELPAAISELPSTSIEGITSASIPGVLASDIESPSYLPEVNHLSTGFSEFFDKFDEACTSLREGYDDMKLEGRLSPAASELELSDHLTKSKFETRGTASALGVLQEEPFRFWSPK